MERFHSPGQYLVCNFIAHEKSSTPIWLVWDSNMAAVSLFWDTNMATVTSRENTLYHINLTKNLALIPSLQGFVVRKLGKQQIVPSFMRLDYEWFSGALAFRSLWGNIGTTRSLCVYKWKKKKQTNKKQ